MKRALVALLFFFSVVSDAHGFERGLRRASGTYQPWRSVPVDDEAPIDGTAIVFTVSSGQLVLNWGDAIGGDVEFYRVCMASGTITPPVDSEACTPPTGCDHPTSSTCTITGLTDMTSYAFRVVAVDESNNASAGLTDWEQPFVDAMALRFGDDSGSTVTNEFLQAADNAIFEAGTVLTIIISFLVRVCIDGATCDDAILSKGPNGNTSYNALAEQGIGGLRIRDAAGALATHVQPNMLRSDGTSSTGIIDRWTRYVVTWNLGGATNDDKVDVFGRQCDNSSPPVCVGATTDMTAGLGTCPSYPCFTGTLPSAFGDQATSFFVGGYNATNNFNFVGSLNEAAAFRVGKVTGTQVNDCILDGTTGKFRNLNTLSKRSSGGVPCDQIFTPTGTERMWWYRGGDREAACSSDNVMQTNWFAPGTGDLTDTNMECADYFTHGL